MVAPSHLKSLQALEMACRLGSLQAAARALSITPAAVGQRIKALEDYLGVDLLTRGRSGLAPSATLAPALGHLRAAFRELEASSELLDLQRGHEIHVAAASDFAELWLRPRLAQFREAHPNISFCINGEGDAPLRIGSVDCEVSFAPVVGQEGRDLLFRDFLVPVSSPENLQRISRIPSDARLEGFPLLHLDFYRDDPAAPNWPTWLATHGHRRSAPERGIRFQRISAAIEAVIADAGLAICGLALLRDWLDDSRLVLPFPVATGSWTTHAFQARYRADALQRPQLRRFRDWLAAQARETEAWLEGYVRA